MLIKETSTDTEREPAISIRGSELAERRYYGT
jgi:hypothetical protein